MPSLSHARTACSEIRSSRFFPTHASAADWRDVVRWSALAVGAVSLGACAQSSVVNRTSELHTASRQAALEPSYEPRTTPVRRVRVARKHDPFPSHKTAEESKVKSYGVASFYSEGAKTANGESFNPNELTAANRTLPFGTRLRVTNVATGQSVTVRVNDRGPFVPGRDVDVSHSAAEALGMVDGGVAKVKMDVVKAGD